MSIIESRDYQIRVVRNVMKAIKAGHQSILVVAPTGSGKTIMAHQIAGELHKMHGWKGGWTCMRKVLVEQAQRENFDKFQFDFMHYFSTFDKHPEGCDFLIEDEGQHSASVTATVLASTLKPKVHIALTATPFRTDRMKLCFSKVVTDAGIRQLVDAKWLSPFHLYTHNLAWTPENIASLYAQDVKRWGKSVIFFLTVEDCYKCQQELLAKGILSEVVHGGSDQETQIERFNNGGVDVLINVFVLTEGFDAPQLQTVFVRPSSKGPTIQMGGRSLRKHPNKPNANIVQSSLKGYSFGNVASPEDRFILENGEWVSIGKISKNLFVMQSNVIRAMAANGAPKVPEYLLKKRTKTQAIKESRRSRGLDDGNNDSTGRTTNGVDYAREDVAID